MSKLNHEKIEQFKKGELRLADACDINAGQTAALLATVFTLFRNGRYKDARDILEGLAVLNQDNAYIHGLLGAVYQRLSEFDRAIEHYDIALRLFPQDIHSLANKGEIYLKLGRLDEAFTNLKRAIELDTNKKHPVANRARILIALTQEALKSVSEQGMQEIVRAKILLNQQAAQLAYN
jgi:Flp pilus assembly protein TadD